jgi:hypothetical protein
MSADAPKNRRATQNYPTWATTQATSEPRLDSAAHRARPALIALSVIESTWPKHASGRLAAI